MNKKHQLNGKVGYLAEDFVMLFLLALNLLWISFDWLFQSETFRSLVFSVSESFHDFYLFEIHPDFIFYDLIFISIFLTEFFIRWAVSVSRNEYEKWYYYPFIYWYDIVGCIPIGAFRFMRLFRIITIITRLHRLGWIDITGFGPYKLFVKYSNLFVQEVTDRVTLKILANVKDELEGGSIVVDRIVEEVVLPRRDELTAWIAARLRLAAKAGYRLHEDEIRTYVQHRINIAIENNKELGTLETVPFMGKFVVKQIEGAVSDIVFSVVHGIIDDLGSENNTHFVDNISDLLIEQDNSVEHPELATLNNSISELIGDSILIIMDRVKDKPTPESVLKEGEKRLSKSYSSTINNS